MSEDRLMKTIDAFTQWTPSEAPAPEPGISPESRSLTPVPLNDGRGRCIHEIFEAQAGQTPDAIAVEFEGQTLTYCELNTRANRLGHRLQREGVRPDTLVAICVERSLEMVVGLLGILKAGGAYVPLDPNYPRERLQYILQDCNAPVLVTERHRLKSFPGIGSHVIPIDDDPIENEPSTNPVSGARPSNLIYVIYTSGSTGEPKGSLIEHHCVSRLLYETERWFTFDEQDVWVCFHSYAFDFSVWEIWGALAYGGRLIIIPYAQTREPESFYRLLCAKGVTILNQTPGAFNQLMLAEEKLGFDKDLRLRLVIFGGEKLNIHSLRPWFERHGDLTPRLVNMYGITETTVHVTYRPISRADLEGANQSVIGCAIPDLQVYILDENLDMVPAGALGELCIGGPGLARGYLNRPELNRTKFVANPFGSTPGDRLYRSGDLARALPDGDIEYLGRIDNQVKIRGFRIEPGEIEHAIIQHENVRECLVIAAEFGHADRRLAAFYVPKQNPAPGLLELRHFLAEKLPGHMIPSIIRPVVSIPLTPNGKRDGASLVSTLLATIPAESGEFGAANNLERQIGSIWREILRINEIDLDTNFFDLGGDSLQMVRVRQKLFENEKLEVPITALFQFPTVRSLARYLSAAPAPGTPTAPELKDNTEILLRAARQKEAMNRRAGSRMPARPELRRAAEDNR